MNIFDRAKDTVQTKFKGIGEETVRVMDAVKEEPEEKKKQPKPAKPKPKPAPKKATAPKPAKDPANSIMSRVSKAADKIKAEANKPKPKPEPKPAKEPKPKTEKKVPEVKNSEFDLTDTQGEQFIAKAEKRHKQKKAQEDNIKTPTVDNGKIQDVLEVLNIKPTFEIESDIFLPEDIEDITFDIQVPQGYEMGEVDTFKSRVKLSLNKLVELLTIRNEDVAKMATVIDRLQVDAHNLKFEKEIANGINIMTTGADEDLEQENYELKVLNKRLEERLAELEEHTPDQEADSDSFINNDEREKFEELQDQYSLLQREVQKLEDENYDLKNQIATLLEEQETTFDTIQNGFDNEIPYDAEDADYSEDLSNVDTPHFFDEEETGEDDELPDFDLNSDYSTSTPGYESSIPQVADFTEGQSNSAFYTDEKDYYQDMMENSEEYIQNNSDDEDIFGSNVEIMGDEDDAPLTYFDEEDEDDALSQLENWNRNNR